MLQLVKKRVAIGLQFHVIELLNAHRCIVGVLSQQREQRKERLIVKPQGGVCGGMTSALPTFIHGVSPEARARPVAWNCPYPASRLVANILRELPRPTGGQSNAWDDAEFHCSSY